MSQTQGQSDKQHEDELHGYRILATACLSGIAPGNFHVAGIVSATERGTTLRMERDPIGAGNNYAFKFVETPTVSVSHSGVDLSYFRATIENETKILSELREYTHDLLVAGSTSEKRSWVMTRWLAGQSASQQARTLRQRLAEQTPVGDTSSEVRRDLLALIVRVFGTVADLHDLGYTHGDIQPAHLINDGEEGRLSLIDFGLARRQQAEGIPYRGAIVHFAAPEVAAGMQNGSTDIAYDVLSEVYSVASVAFQLYTGKTTTAYDNDANGKSIPFEEKLTRIMDTTGRWRRSFASVGARPLPVLEAVLERCLSLDRSKRCSSLRSAYEELRAIDSET